MLLHLTDISSESLRSQVTRQIRAQILRGDLCTGGNLPSIRALAREQHISVITIQNAYDDLQREGIIHSKRGKGFFVSELTEKQKKKIALDRFRDSINPKIKSAKQNGLSEKEIIRVINQTIGDKNE